MLDREGDGEHWLSSNADTCMHALVEVARATTVVEFDAGTEFPEHVHGGGEGALSLQPWTLNSHRPAEFLVLSGVFSDQIQVSKAQVPMMLLN